MKEQVHETHVAPRGPSGAAARSPDGARVAGEAQALAVAGGTRTLHLSSGASPSLALPVLAATATEVVGPLFCAPVSLEKYRNMGSSGSEFWKISVCAVSMGSIVDTCFHTSAYGVVYLFARAGRTWKYGHYPTSLLSGSSCSVSVFVCFSPQEYRIWIGVGDDFRILFPYFVQCWVRQRTHVHTSVPEACEQISEIVEVDHGS